MADSPDFYTSEILGDRFTDFCVHIARFSGNRLQKVSRLEKIGQWDHGITLWSIHAANDFCSGEAYYICIFATIDYSFEFVHVCVASMQLINGKLIHIGSPPESEPLFVQIFSQQWMDRNIKNLHRVTLRYYQQVLHFYTCCFEFDNILDLLDIYSVKMFNEFSSSIVEQISV